MFRLDILNRLANAVSLSQKLAHYNFTCVCVFLSEFLYKCIIFKFRVKRKLDEK